MGAVYGTADDLEKLQEGLPGRAFEKRCLFLTYGKVMCVFWGEGKASCLKNVICKFGLFMTYYLILVQIRYKDTSEALAVMWFCTFLAGK